jgi:hypothetical protein
MASAGVVFECLLVIQSFTIPGVYSLWQPMHAWVWGLSELPVIKSPSLSSAKIAVRNNMHSDMKHSKKEEIILESFMMTP